MSDVTERRAGPLDLAAFVATAVASFALRWNLAELVWGLWLSSLLVGYALIVHGILSAAFRPWPPTTAPEARAKPDISLALAALPAGAGIALRLAGGAFMLAFFTVHFGGFHFVHGIFLGVFFPLAPGQQAFDAVFENAGLALRGSWPLVLTTAVSMRRTFEDARREFKPQTPYLGVIRMHFLIFVFFGAKMLQLDNRWLYIVVLFFYFFPIAALRGLWRRTT